MVSYSLSAHRGFSMDQQDNIKDSPSGTAASGSAVTPKLALAGAESMADVAPAAIAAPAVANTESPKIESPKLEAPGTEIPKSDAPKVDTPDTAIPKAAAPAPAMPAAQHAPKLEAESIGTPAIALAHIEAPRIAPEIGDHDRDGADRPAGTAAPRLSRFTLLAASLALAAALGGMTGALVSRDFAPPAPTPAVAIGRTGIEEFQALKENVVQARVELAALKATIDAANRNASTQLTKIGERVDRVERNQTEPTAKINKAIESLDRLARAETTARDVTGSIAPPQPVGAAGKVVDGWVVRDVRRGTALIEGRLGMIEVDAGDVVPGLGRIDAIRKQDGRWVVVTARGLILSAR
jgi:hypothetical protein